MNILKVKKLTYSCPILIPEAYDVLKYLGVIFNEKAIEEILESPREDKKLYYIVEKKNYFINLL